jgi:hypothetical protein
MIALGDGCKDLENRAADEISSPATKMGEILEGQNLERSKSHVRLMSTNYFLTRLASAMPSSSQMPPGASK